jgi:hypothetical protein
MLTTVIAERVRIGSDTGCDERKPYANPASANSDTQSGPIFIQLDFLLLMEFTLIQVPIGRLCGEMLNELTVLLTLVSHKLI